ncbi:hypothetical protein GCM10023238_22320 [Streptomyces heliomycini]
MGPRRIAERIVNAERDGADIVRFPIVMGSRTDGALDRYSGFFWLPAAMCNGAVPALVAEEKGLLDMVSTDRRRRARDPAARLRSTAGGTGCRCSAGATAPSGSATPRHRSRGPERLARRART